MYPWISRTLDFWLQFYEKTVRLIHGRLQYKATRIPIYSWQWRHCFLFDKYMFQPLPNWVVWDIYGPYMGMIRDNLWAIQEFHKFLIWDITYHIKPIWWHVLPLYCLIYGKAMYFVKFHTIPRYGNDMGYGNGMGWLPCKGMIWEWYGRFNQSHT